MKTKEQILLEIQNAMTLNKDNVAKCNSALSDAKSLIMHETKELQNRLDEEYKHGVNDAWVIAQMICDTDYNMRTYLFGNHNVEYVIRNFSPTEVKEKITSHKVQEENGSNKIHIGDVVQDNNDDTKATVLDYDHDTNLVGKGYWTVFTENGCVESWRENEFTRTGESVDVYSALIK